MIPVLLGGSLVYGLTNSVIIDVLGHAGEYPGVLARWDACAVFGGIVFYGGLLGGLAALAVGCRMKDRQLTCYLDLFAVVVPLSTSQWISIALIVATAFCLMRHRPAGGGEWASGKERVDAAAQTCTLPLPHADRGV